jgi:hypothetical protein
MIIGEQGANADFTSHLAVIKRLSGPGNSHRSLGLEDMAKESKVFAALSILHKEMH